MPRKDIKIGQRIRHTEPEYDGVTEGVVVVLLSVQFLYTTDQGRTRFCFYRDLWEKTKDEHEETKTIT